MGTVLAQGRRFCVLIRRQDLSLSRSMALAVPTESPLGRVKAGEGEELLTRFFKTVCDSAALEMPFPLLWMYGRTTSRGIELLQRPVQRSPRINQSNK